MISRKYYEAAEEFLEFKYMLSRENQDKKSLYEIAKNLCSKYLKCLIRLYVSEDINSNILNSLSLKELCNYIRSEMPDLDINYRKIFIIEDPSFSFFTDEFSIVRCNTGLLLNSVSYCKEITEGYIIKSKLNNI